MLFRSYLRLIKGARSSYRQLFSGHGSRVNHHLLSAHLVIRSISRAAGFVSQIIQVALWLTFAISFSELVKIGCVKCDGQVQNCWRPIEASHLDQQGIPYYGPLLVELNFDVAQDLVLLESSAYSGFRWL